MVLPALGKEVVTIVMKTARDRAGDLDVPFWKLMPLMEELHRHLWKPCQLLWKNVQNMAGKCAVNHLFTFISKILTLEIPESSPDRMALEKASFQDGGRRMNIENHIVSQMIDSRLTIPAAHIGFRKSASVVTNAEIADRSFPMSRKIIRFDKNKRPSSGRSAGSAPIDSENSVAPTKQSVSILIISDDTLGTATVCGSLNEMLAYDADIATVKSVDEAHATSENLACEILILDEGIASERAFSLARKLANQKPSCGPILLSSEPATSLLYKGLAGQSGRAAIPNAVTGILRVLPKSRLSPRKVEKTISDVLAAGRRRDVLLDQLQDVDPVRRAGSNQILPWMRTMLRDINKIHGGASLALHNVTQGESSNSIALLESTVSVADRMRGELMDAILNLQSKRSSKPNRNPQTSPGLQTGELPQAADQIEDVDITRLLDRVVRENKLDAEERGQTLQYQRPDLPITLAANSFAVRDVFRVILRNTIRNIAANTKIDIALSIHAGEVCISICDTSPDGHWTSVNNADRRESAESGLSMQEKAGSIILINELMRECNGSIDVVTTRNDANELRCFFPRSGVA